MNNNNDNNNNNNNNLSELNSFNDFFNKNYTYAIVGASNNENKYGFKIVKILLENGFNVIPINPKEKKILGLKTYKSILDVKDKIDVVDFVVPPKITLQVLEEVLKTNINKVWFQPNSFDENAIKFVKKNKINYLKDFCLLKSVLKNL